MKFEATADQIRTLVRLAELSGEHVSSRGRGALTRRLPQPVLDRYDALLEAHRNPPIATIERGTCSGCHVRLPTMVEYKILHTLGLYTCPHCKRMVYARELLGAPAAQDAERGAPRS